MHILVLLYLLVSVVFFLTKLIFIFFCRSILICFYSSFQLHLVLHTVSNGSFIQLHLVFNRISSSIASLLQSHLVFNRISSSIASHLQPHVIFNRIFPSNASFLLSHLAFNRIPLHWLRHHSLVGPLLYPTTPSRHEAHRPPRLESL